MTSIDDRTVVRRYVAIAAIIGLCLSLILANVRDSSDSRINTPGFICIFGAPFLLAVASLAIPDHRVTRRIWLISAILATAAGLPLIFNGVGVFFLAIAFCFAWASRTACKHGPVGM